MIFGMIFFCLICGFSGYAALKISGERISPGIWDYVYPVTGISTWTILYASGAGSMVSGTNFLYETFWIFSGSIIIPWIRLALSFAKYRPIAVISLMFTFIPVVLAVSLRLLMPSLPD